MRPRTDDRFHASRRSFLRALASLALWPAAGAAAGAAGRVESLIGACLAEAGGAPRPLAEGSEIFVGDLVSAGENARLAMLLGADTHVRLGARTRLKIDRFLVSAGGELRFDSGPLVIDRDEGAPPLPLRARSPYGMIALRGTRVFAGPSNGRFGVFVARGVVDFTAGGKTVRLTTGEGSDVRRPGDPPSPPARWSETRAIEALQSVY